MKEPHGSHSSNTAVGLEKRYEKRTVTKTIESESRRDQPLFENTNEKRRFTAGAAQMRTEEERESGPRKDYLGATQQAPTIFARLPPTARQVSTEVMDGSAGPAGPSYESAPPSRTGRMESGDQIRPVQRWPRRAREVSVVDRRKKNALDQPRSACAYLAPA